MDLNIENYLKNYIYAYGQDDNLSQLTTVQVDSRIESRTRNADMTDALRMRVYDPLWMLARQWQLGEFKGNDAGTAMSVQCTVGTRDIGSFGLGAEKQDGRRSRQLESDVSEKPIEPLVEQIDREITPLVRVESAMYYIDLLRLRLKASELRPIIDSLRKQFPLDPADFDGYGSSSVETDAVQAFTREQNSRLALFSEAYRDKAFDGYKLYLSLNATWNTKDQPEKKTYINWFRKRYLPVDGQQGAWVDQKLGYDFEFKNSAGRFKAEDYTGGRVSWYSFDCVAPIQGNQNENIVKIPTLPTLATYPGAPNKRLWQFEDRKVFMGNSSEMQAKGNVAFLQYATMYGNDWMICPLQTEIGKYLTVKSIQIRDSFGIPTTVKRRAGNEPESNNVSFGQRWQMYTNAPADIDTGQQADGLLFPPSLISTQEGETIEEVSLLRDEMANMVWGVEQRADDGCGSTLDTNLLAAKVKDFIEEGNREILDSATYKVSKDEDGNVDIHTDDRKAALRYVVQTSVPLNWIPFVPQHLENEKGYEDFLGGREVILRRGKMPLAVLKEGTKDELPQYLPVRPLTSILRKGIEGSKEKPLFINEEEVQGVGTVLRKNCQRSRWLKGETYNWMGYYKQIRNTQGVSGLEFDKLLDAEDGNC